MTKILKIILLTLLFLCTIFSINCYSHTVEDSFPDKVAEIIGENVEINNHKLNIYFFHSKTCSHCKEENKFLDELELTYGDKINILRYEVSQSEKNATLLRKVKNQFGENANKGIPFTVIGEKTFTGYSESMKANITSTVMSYLTNYEKNNDIFHLPIIGETNIKSVSTVIIAMILGFVDGFNPCAMWILLLLINIALSINDKKKMFLIGSIFIATSGFVYFLAMLGLGLILEFSTIVFIRILIGIIAISLGICNIYTYIKTKNETGCTVVNDKKRKSITYKLKNIFKEKNLFIAIIGIILLAFSVNLIELSCSLGFPTIFLEILSLNDINGLSKILYLLLYVIFYMLDDTIVFLIALFTLQINSFGTKYNKLVKFIGGILMLIMGILLIFKPEWIMFNF